MDSTAQLSVLCSAGIFFTTIQSQDFKDIEGDALIGRQTIPIVHPKLAAPTLALALQIWSVLLAYAWQANILTSIAVNTLSLGVGFSFLMSACVKEYQRSFYLYNVSRLTGLIEVRAGTIPTLMWKRVFFQVWLTAMHALPLCRRFATAAASQA